MQDTGAYNELHCSGLCHLVQNTGAFNQLQCTDLYHLVQDTGTNQLRVAKQESMLPMEFHKYLRQQLRI